MLRLYRPTPRWRHEFLRFLYAEFGTSEFTLRDVIEKFRAYNSLVDRRAYAKVAVYLNRLHRSGLLASRWLNGRRRIYWVTKKGVERLRYYGLLS